MFKLDCTEIEIYTLTLYSKSRNADGVNINNLRTKYNNDNTLHS